MFSTRIFKSVIAMLLLLTLTCGLLACGAAPSEKSFNKAYDKEVDNLLDGIGDYYDRVDDYDTDNMKMDLEIGVDLSDDLLSLLRSYTSYDLSFINDAKIKLSENFKNDIISVALGLAYGKTDIVAADMIMDIAGENSYVGIPVLSDVFYKAPIEVSGANSLSDILELGSDTLLPDQKALKSLVKKVYNVVMDGIGEPTFAKTELTVNGVTESCVAYENKLSQKQIVAIAVDLFEMLKSDEDFKKIVVDFVTAMKEFSSDDIEGTPEEAYEELVDIFQEAIDTAPADATDETALVLTSYVDDKLNIIGSKVVLYDVEDVMATFYMATAQNKDDVGREIYFANSESKLFEITGDLTDDGKTLAGTYELKIEGQSMVFLDLENVNVKKLEDGYFVGTASLSPSKGFIDMITEDADVELSGLGLTVANLSVKIDVEKNDGKEAKIAMSLMNGSTPYASITMDSKISDGEKVTLPGNTTTDAETWPTGFEFDKLADNVSKSGLPDFIVEFVEMLASSQQ